MQPAANVGDVDAQISSLDGAEEVNKPFQDGQGLSRYETVYKSCAAFVCRMPGDKFAQLQKILLKHIFSECNVRSLLASDLYMFLARLLHPDYRKAMCQLVMNLSKLAPQHIMVKGAALVNRLKDPEVNFGNPKYKDIITFD